MNTMTPKKLSMVTRAGHIYRSKMENDSLFFDDKCDPLELLLMIFLVLLDLSHQDLFYSTCVITIKVLIYL
jgi:hypothetical protein